MDSERRDSRQAREKEHGLQKLANDFADRLKNGSSLIADGDTTLFQWFSTVSLVPPMLLFLGGCDASHKDVSGAKTGRQTAMDEASNQPMSANNSGKKMTNEQAPINQRFTSLDEYLAHLQRTQGPVDGPWYREVRPGIYELQTGNLHLDAHSAEKQSFTREELAEKFGFPS